MATTIGYILLTDIARDNNAGLMDDLIRNWLRNRKMIEFFGNWESLNNPGSKPVEFDGFRKGVGLNSFALPPRQWIEKIGAVGILSKPGRYGGTFAHTDIAFEFPTWISVEFNLFLIKEFRGSRRTRTAASPSRGISTAPSSSSTAASIRPRSRPT